MKKGLLTIIIAVFTVINLILTSILVFAIVPVMNDSSKVIKKISNIIDLETNTSAEGSSDVPIDKLVVYNIEEKLTIALQTGADNKAHYAVVNAALYLNSQHADFEKYNEKIADQEPLIRETINNIVSKYNIDELKDNKDEITTEILEKIRDEYKSDFIYKVVFSDFTLQ